MKEMKEDKVNIIPAAPRFFILDPMTAMETGIFDGFVKEPIVAWRIVTTHIYDSKDTFSVAEPVTLETVGDNYFILTPSGEVIDPEVAWFKNEEDAAKAAKEQMSKRAATSNIS